MPAESLPQGILAEIGWDDVNDIAVANAENKELANEISRVQKQLQDWLSRLADDTDRVTTLKDHLKNVQAEVNSTEEINRAQEKTLETEIHLRKVAEREMGRLQQELNKLDKVMVEQKERKNFLENTVFKQNQLMEDKKTQMNWDNQALDEWLKECKRHDDDAMAIAKYAREDEDKVMALTVTTHKLMDELAKQKRALDNEYLETQTAQVELDKTAEDFRKCHIERQELLHRWETTISQMSKRDEEMHVLALELEKARANARAKENLCKEKERFYESEIANNKDLTYRMEKTSSDVSQLRNEHQQEEKKRLEILSEVDSLGRIVDRTAYEVEAARSQVTQLKQETTKRNKKFDHLKIELDRLQKKLQQTQDAKLSAEEQSARVLQMLHQEQQAIISIQSELKQLQQSHKVRMEEHLQLKNESKRIETEIQGTRTTITNLNSKIREKDKESLRLEENLYKQNYQIQLIQRRLNRMEGDTNNEEQAALQAKIRELESISRKRISVKNLLIDENKRQQDEVRKEKRQVECSKSNKDDLKKKIDELELHLFNAEKDLRNSTNEKQEQMVEKNLLGLTVRRLVNQLQQHSGQVLSLEKERLQMETAMKERSLYINSLYEMLTKQLRVAEDERRETNIELQERITRIDKVKKRFECFFQEEHSQSYYIIKAAQEKEELQRNLDELTGKKCKAEKELCVLNNTFQYARSKNDSLRRAQVAIPEYGEEINKMKELEEAFNEVVKTFLHKRKAHRELTEDLRQMEKTLEYLNGEESTLADAIVEKQVRIMQLHRDLEDQLKKLERVNKQNYKMVKDIRNVKKVKETEEEHDVDLRAVRALNKNALKLMGEAVQKYQELAPSVHHYLEQAGLPLPSVVTPGSRTSSSSTLSSFRSSLFGSPSLSSGRSGSSSDSLKRKFLTARVESPVFTIFGDNVRVKPDYCSSASTISQRKPPSGSRTSSQSSVSMKNITVFGDDLTIRGSLSELSQRSHTSSLDRKPPSPKGSPEAFVLPAIHDRVSPLARRRSSAARSPENQEIAYEGSRRQSATRGIQRRPSASRRPSAGGPRPSIDESFTIFGFDPLSATVRSEPSPDPDADRQGGPSQRSGRQ